MQTAKRFLVVAGLVIGLLAVVLLLVNIYLQSSSVQERIRSAASRAVGGPVNVRSTLYTPWGGLVLKEISIPDVQNPELNIIRAAALQIKFAWWPLLQRKFVISDIVLTKPDVLVRQSSQGSWVLFPLPPPEGLAAAPARESPEQLVASPGARFTVHIRRVRIRGGHATIVDSQNRPVISLNETEFDARVTDEGRTEGRVAIGSADVAGVLKPKAIAGDFTWDGSVLDVPNITGNLADGKIKGKYRLDAPSGQQFALRLSFDQAQLKKLAEEAGFASESAQGFARGEATLGGNLQSAASVDGNGSIELIKAQMQPLDFIQKLGQVLNVDELQVLRLKDARAEFRIRGDRVNFRNITLQSENLILSGKGPIRFNGRINMDGALHVNEKLQRQLKGVLSNNFVPSDVAGYVQVPFDITGSLNNPKTDLLDKLIGMNIGQNMGGFLRNLFQPPKQDATPAQQNSP